MLSTVSLGEHMTWGLTEMVCFVMMRQMSQWHPRPLSCRCQLYSEYNLCSYHCHVLSCWSIGFIRQGSNARYKWINGVVQCWISLNAVCVDLGPICLWLLSVHALSGCGTTSYPYGKGTDKCNEHTNRWGFPSFGCFSWRGNVGAIPTHLVEETKAFLVCMVSNETCL